MGEGCVLASDIGSSACKTILVDLQGNTLAASQKEFTSFYPHPGWVEQDPREWYDAFCETTRQVLTQSGAQSRSILGVGLVGVTHNFVMLGDDEQPLARSILMFDTRSSRQVEAILGRWGDEVNKRTLNDVTTTWSWPQLLWVKENTPAEWAALRHLLFPKDYVRHRLAPSLRTDHIDASGTLLFDPVEGTWIVPFCEELGLDIDSLPPAVDPFSIVSEVSARGSADSGLPRGTPVIAGTTDTVAEVLGSGATRQGEATVKLASVGRIAIVSDGPVRRPHVFNYRHVFPGMWYPGTACKSAAAAYHWLRDVLLPGHKGLDAYKRMDAEAEAIPIGSGGLLFHPHLMGEWAPHWDDTMRGALLGLTARHSRAHIARAVLEGVAFNLKDAMSEIEAYGVHASDIRLIGQGSRSGLWARIVADVLDRPLYIPRNADAVYGGALITAAAVAPIGRDGEGLRSLTKMEGRVDPCSANAARYEELFAIYRSADAVCKPISARLKRFEEHP